MISSVITSYSIHYTKLYDAIGINCSLGPKQIKPIVKELSKWTNLPLVVKPNAGLPDPVTNKYDVLPEEFAQELSSFVEYGVCIMGGCCGTTPEYIKELVNKVKGKSPNFNNSVVESAVCSATKTVVVNQPRIIGERINPTGKKLFKQALKDNNIGYILNQAIEHRITSYNVCYTKLLR